MKYAIIDQTTDDWFVVFFDSEQEALYRADIDWNSLSQYDKDRRTAFFVASVYVDEDWAYEVVDVVKVYKYI